MPSNPRHPKKTPTLAECIFAFDCLRTLKDIEDDAEQKYKQYLELLRQWRNDEPNATEDEVNAALKVVSTKYLYVVAYSITDLEVEGVI